jgi:hypothetical protein
MAMDPVTRRAVLKSLTMSVAAGSVLRVIPMEAAEHAHHAIEAEKEENAGGAYAPKFFDAHGYKTLQALCETILPADADAGGAVEGGAPEFIDLLTSENAEYQSTLSDLLRWLDANCTIRYGKPWVDCAKEQQTEILDLVAYQKNAEKDESLYYPVLHFAFLRNFTADGFFTSKIGIKYLGYKGNTYLTEFPGCPPVPGV